MEKTIKLELTLVLNTSTPDEPLCAQYLEALDNWFLRCLNGERVTCAHIDAAVLAPDAPEVHRGHTRDKQPRRSLKT